MVVMHSRIGKYLDVVATVMLAVSVVLVVVSFVDLFTPPPDAIGVHPNRLKSLAEASIFLGILSMPNIICAIAWPIHMRQQRRGGRVFGWLRFVVIASAIWMYFVFISLSGI